MTGFRIDAILFAKMLRSPAGIDSIQQYKDYLINLVAGLDTEMKVQVEEPPKQEHRAPGRPIKYGHPAYDETEFKAIRNSIVNEINEYPHYYTAKNGKEAKGLAKEQPEDETIFVLDNGVELHYAGRVTETDYPPSIIGGKD